jgi:hypothetical protein
MNTRKSMLSATVVLGALVAFAGLPAGVALAGTGINVPCSGPGGGAAGLVAAINAANAARGGTISLAPRCTYTLTAADNNSFGGNGLPVITAPIIIAGAHATIARHSAQHFRIFEVDGPGGSLAASALTITGGDVGGPGGGVFNNAGTLRLNASVVSGNASEGGMMSAGGGIASGTIGNGPAGTLVLNASQVTGNTTSGDAGGILNHAGTAVLNASRVSGNTSGSGGGIASGPGNPDSPVTASSLTLNGSRVDHNTAAEGGGEASGGGIANGGTVVLRGSSVDHNSAAGGAGAGIFNHGTMTITGSQITGNTAPTDNAGNDGNVGGILNVNFGIPPSGGSGVLTITGSTVSGNSASGFGGGLGNAPDSTATITGTSVSGNSAGGAGGGVVNFGALAMTGSRVLDNTAAAGGGIANQEGGTVTLTGTRVAGNVPDNCEPPGTIAGCTG